MQLPALEDKLKKQFNSNGVSSLLYAHSKASKRIWPQFVNLQLRGPVQSDNQTPILICVPAQLKLYTQGKTMNVLP